MKYNCEFPGCSFATNNRNEIHEHHIIPKEAGGLNNKWNKIFFCATHHGFIFCEQSRHGQHSIRTNNSIILKGWRFSTGGKILEYIDEKGDIQFYDRNNFIMNSIIERQVNNKGEEHEKNQLLQCEKESNG